MPGARADAAISRLRHETASHNPSGRSLRPEFGSRASDFLRVSGFGLRISSSLGGRRGVSFHVERRRNPKPEIRSPKEGRNPNTEYRRGLAHMPEARADTAISRLRHETASHNPSGRSLRHEFGSRASDFLRYSVFGFRISSSLGARRGLSFHVERRGNPKPETRNPKEGRNPNTECRRDLAHMPGARADAAISRLRHETASHNPSGRSLRPEFGSRASDFLRVSGFGFRISSSLPLTRRIVLLEGYPFDDRRRVRSRGGRSA